MSTSSLSMLSNISMERLYLSQPPAWNDLQRLTLSINPQQQQQQDTRSSQHILRTCYDKLLHRMYDINSSATTTLNQLNEQIELAAEYCQLKILRDGNTVYLHSGQFYLEINFDSLTNLPINVAISFSNEQQTNEEPIVCPQMLKALNEKQYKLFREHLNGYASLFTLTASNMNNEKRIGYTAYRILEQDLEYLAKTDLYGNLFEGFQAMSEGLPMRIRFEDQVINQSVSVDNVRIIIVPSNNQHYLPIKSSIHLDEKTNTIQIDSSIKSNMLATGHFALEFTENQPPFIFLLTYAQEISRLTNFNNFLSNVKPFNYLSTVLPKTKSFNQYQWYISHDQLAVSIRQIPFTNLKQLIHILNLIRQQIYLTSFFDYYFSHDDDHEHMDDDTPQHDISLEMSFISSTILSITCAQSYRLSTFLLQMSNINTLPILMHRQQQKEFPLTDEKDSLFNLIEKLLKEENFHQPSLLSNAVDFKEIDPSQEQSVSSISSVPKLNRRLSCGPPAKPTWRRATTLRRVQAACLTLTLMDNVQERIDDEQVDDAEEDYFNQNLTNESLNDEDETFLQSTEQPTQHYNHGPILPKPSLSFHPSVLSRCTSASSTQSVSTPPIFGLSPSTPYPGGMSNPNGNIFFPIGKQVSVPEYSPVTSPITMGTFDPLAFLPASATSSSNLMPSADPNNKNQQKKKRRRSEHSADDFIPTMNNNPNDNRSPMHATKLSLSSGDPSNIKRGKKPNDKNSQQQQQQQLVRQKSAFKVTDPSTSSLLSQQSVTSPDDTSNELKPLKVVIKRVGDSGNSSNEESQHQSMKQRKKQQIGNTNNNNNNGSIPAMMRKLSNNNPPSGSSPSILVKSESLDMSQLNSDPNMSSMMTGNDAMQQSPRERPRPSSSLSNPLTSSSLSASSQPRSAPPQPPIVLKIQRSKVYPGQDQSSSSTSTTPATAVTNTAPASNSIPATIKDVLKNRTRSMPTGANTIKQNVASPPLLAAKLTSPSTGTATNPLASTTSVTPSFRIPRKSSSQEVATKAKTESGTINTSSSPVLPKIPLLSAPGVRPAPPPSQIGSWQSPPTQQPSRFNQNRPRASWSQQQQQPPPRARVPVTPPNPSIMNSGHSSLGNFSQPPRSILKRPPSNENSSSDLLYMSASELPGMNEQRTGAGFSVPPPPARTATPPGMYDDNDDDSSPQAQLVIDTGSTTTNNVLLPYTIVPGSSASSTIDSFDQNHENNSTMNTSQQQLSEESFSNLD